MNGFLDTPVPPCIPTPSHANRDWRIAISLFIPKVRNDHVQCIHIVKWDFYERCGVILVYVCRLSEAKKKKQENTQTEEDLGFPGREHIKFGDVVEAPPKLTVPKVFSFNIYHEIVAPLLASTVD